MSNRRRNLLAVLAISGITLLTIAGSEFSLSQDEWKWPEKPKNIQVLSKDITGAKLSPIMRGFSRALGVRCSYCHVGEEGKDLSTYDFASDANPNKDRAREMYRMLGDINTHLKKIEPSSTPRVNMWCQTCHRGRPRPLTLTEELSEQYRSNGIDSALSRYQTLKARYLDRGAYDFSEGSLNEWGYDLLEKDKAAAIKVFALNAEVFPKSANVWDSLGEAYLKSGDLKMAKQNYEKSLALDPRSESAIENLKKINAALQK